MNALQLARRCSLPLALAALPGCVAWALATPERGWPTHDGAIEVRGLERDARIDRDVYGTPHIAAATEEDAWFALGFAHGQDRLFQADLTRRTAFGGLSEWVGDDAVLFDAFMQSLRLRQHAMTELERATPAVRSAIEAYTAGINAAASDSRALPVEYRVLGARWEPWAPSDSLGVAYLMAWSLAENPSAELLALDLGHELSAAELDDVVRVDQREPRVDLFWDRLREQPIGELTPSFQAFWSRLGHTNAQASNAWAVSAARSATGNAMLASDPHLHQTFPSVWYPVTLDGGELHVAGVTVAGAPAVAIGQTQRLSWAFTSLMADTVDLAVLARSGPQSVLIEGRPSGIAMRHARVKSRDGDRDVDVPWTELGPVITDPTAETVVVLRWSALDVEDRTLELYDRLLHAQSAAEALEVGELPTVLAQNLVVADARGHIGWTPIGALVRRRGYTGRVPYPASEAAFGWQGWLDRRPVVLDPPEGVIVSANQRPDLPFADAISTAFAPNWRYDRIHELLAARSRHTWASLAAAQLDVFDPHAAAQVDRLLPPEALRADEARPCAALLTGWDHSADASSAGALVWATFEADLLRDVLHERLSDQATARVLATVTPGQTLLDDHPERIAADLQGAAASALTQTCATLTSKWGPDPAAWTWGAEHTLTLEHPFGAELPAWSPPARPWPGTATTVRATLYHPDDLRVAWMPSMRAIFTPATSAITLSHPGGAVGQPGHPLSLTLLDAHESGKQVPLAVSLEQEPSRLLSSLLLHPVR